MIDELDILEEEINGMDVTPMVNLSLVLLLIFMVTSPFFTKTLMPVNVPQAVTSKTEDQENITISISPVDGYGLNEELISKKDLARELRAAMKTSGISYVLIRADERVPHGEIEDVMKIGKRLGVKRIAFATIPKVR